MLNGLCYRHMMIINDNSSIINKLEASLTDDASVVIYNRQMFIVQATDHSPSQLCQPRGFQKGSYKEY
jgi:hypothetical protein